LSIGPPADAVTAVLSASTIDAGAKVSPGFVQNWPTPRVSDPAKPAAVSVVAAPGRITVGLTLPSSP